MSFAEHRGEPSHCRQSAVNKRLQPLRITQFRCEMGTNTPRGLLVPAVTNLHQEWHMRKFILPMIVVMTLGIATHARAYDSGDLISMQRALAIATDLGLVTVSHTEFAGYEWQIEGRDLEGRYMEVDVDARTGAVLNVDR
ncbi:MULTISPECIES: PepSY domain-containing protein [unclassified Bradyrhizobium]